MADSKELSFEKAVRWAKALEVRWEWLLMGEGLPWPDSEPPSYSADTREIADLLEETPSEDRAAVVAAIKTLLKRAGYTLVLGSNTNGIHAPFYRRRYREALDHFDHFVYSHEARFLKPDRGFFEACVQAAGVPAGSCLFIDDLEANVEGAREAGLRGIVYRGDTRGLVDDLRAAGVEVPGDLA